MTNEEVNAKAQAIADKVLPVPGIYDVMNRDLADSKRGLIFAEVKVLILELAGPISAQETEAPQKYAVECKCGKKFLTHEVGMDHVEHCQRG